MKITLKDIESTKVALCHLMLNNKEETVKAIVNTDEWKLPENSKDKVVNVTMQFNGIEADPQILEKLMTDWYHSIHEEYKKKYSDLNAEVESRVNKRVQEIVNEQIEPYEKRLSVVIENLEEAKNNLSFLSHDGWE